MKYPNLSEERKLWKRGHKCVVGLDEVGRGPLAGPVVACAVLIGPDCRIAGVKDSKQLSVKKREEIYRILVNHPKISYGIGRVSEKTIDKINILEATKLAMKKAIRGLKPDFLILDGNFKIDSEIPQKSIIKGDKKVMSCAMASIIAKVERDRLMERYHKKYPGYGFDRHKGYGTLFHYEMLEKLGPSVIHRISFNLSRIIV